MFIRKYHSRTLPVPQQETESGQPLQVSEQSFSCNQVGQSFAVSEPIPIPFPIPIPIPIPIRRRRVLIIALMLWIHLIKIAY
eukprot:758317-Hanusia_phi.AAC.8